MGYVADSWDSSDKDYVGLDWSKWLDSGDTIVASTWPVVSGLTIDAEAFTTTVAKVWLSGGTTNTNPTVTNQIVTANGLRKQRSINIPMTEL
jgi:hypothetical protein